ncbi:MAG: ABC transporter substrate-binding protein [Methanothrix sp.]|uniref:ABC transporter substrate-binding protein n=1 Tax=Methanothrix sp. TaxID=90426 RepID=UPI0025E2A4C8|nr:ABC transporter substrate-binding protein [Methanothrix sp.]MCK9406138.1 ABC transporter substrate-binding protein [Methanothrix sp.]
MIREIIIALIICFCLLIPVCSGDTISVVDYTEKQVNLSLPVTSIISLSNMATEIICALDGGNSLIGRPNSVFPAYIDKVEIVGENSRSPDLERIVQLHPDLLIADGMLSDDNRKEIEDAGIPVIIEKFTDPARVIIITENMGQILGKEERAGEIVDFVNEYEKLIDSRTAAAKPDEETSAYVEWNSAYRAASTSSGYNNFIEKASGSNIVTNSSVQYPTIDPEFLIQQDPSVIVKMLSSTKECREEDLIKEHDEISSRSELSSLKAVEEGRIYILSGIVAGGMRSVIGELYFAKWLHPELFQDIDPEAIHEEMAERFFGQELENAYAYPSLKMDLSRK